MTLVDWGGDRVPSLAWLGQQTGDFCVAEWDGVSLVTGCETAAQMAEVQVPGLKAILGAKPNRQGDRLGVLLLAVGEKAESVACGEDGSPTHEIMTLRQGGVDRRFYWTWVQAGYSGTYHATVLRDGRNYTDTVSIYALGDARC